jgi:N-acetyl-anhydromuramyl-L-alanine amidase AmpD
MDSSTIKSHSPNFNDRPQDAKISMIVIHHTELNNIKEVYKIFENPESKVSSQYLIGRDGSLHQFVEDNQRAWHAGVSEWGGKEGLKDYSIGI